MPHEDNIQENISELKNQTFGKKRLDKAKGYKLGAILGGAIGVGAAFIFRGNLLIYGIVGAVAGGAIGYQIAEYKEPTFKLNFSGKKNKKKKTDGQYTRVS